MVVLVTVSCMNFQLELKVYKFLGNKNFVFVEHLEVEHQSVGPKKTTKMIGWNAVSSKMALLGVPSDMEKRVPPTNRTGFATISSK